MYSFESRVRYSEADSDWNMTFPALLNYFQDCCIFQSEELQIGGAYLSEHQVAWVLLSWQVIWKAKPHMGDHVKISTWAYDFGGFYGYRNFTMENEAGDILAYANSVWAYMDLKSGRPTKITPEIAAAYQPEERYPMEYAPRKIALPKEAEEKEPFAVHASMIDTNHHVNNEKYVELAAGYLPEDFAFDQMRAEYRKSAVLGDVIYPSVHISEDQTLVTVVLSDEKKKPFAVVEFRRKEENV